MPLLKFAHWQVWLVTFATLLKTLRMKAYLIDQFGELSLYDIPALLISMIIGAAMVFVLGFALP